MLKKMFKDKVRILKNVMVQLLCSNETRMHFKRKNDNHLDNKASVPCNKSSGTIT